jgi:hypothetical protein
MYHKIRGLFFLDNFAMLLVARQYSEVSLNCRWVMHWEGFGRKLSSLCRGSSETRKKFRAEILTDIRTGCLQNTGRDCCRYVDVLVIYDLDDYSFCVCVLQASVNMKHFLFSVGRELKLIFHISICRDSIEKYVCENTSGTYIPSAILLFSGVRATLGGFSNWRLHLLSTVTYNS